MNWYSTMKKVAFPYGRIKCPSCAKTYVNDFGFKDVGPAGNQKGHTSTQELGGTPFIDFEEKQYEEPIDGVHKDQVERGTVTAQCPNCKQWAEVEYEWNTGSPESQSNDFFSQVTLTEIQPITSEMAAAYRQVGMSSGAAFEDNEQIDTDKLQDPTISEPMFI